MSFFSSQTLVFLQPAKQEGNNRNYDKDYYENFRDFHRKTGDSPCTQQVEHQCQHEEYNSKSNQIHELLTSLLRLFNRVLSELDNTHNHHYNDR